MAAGRWKCQWIGRAAAGLLIVAAARAGRAAEPGTIGTATGAATSQAGPALRVQLTQSDHASGIYYAKEEGTLTLTVENTGAGEMVFKDGLEFGPAAGRDEIFKAISITPVTATTLAAGQRVRLAMKAVFASPGRYEVRCGGRAVELPAGFELECIYPPRGEMAAGEGGRGGAATQGAGGNPWVARMPRAAATVAGFLSDYTKRTSIGRFVVDDPWPTPVANGQPVFGAELGLSTSAMETLLTEADRAGAQIILRVQLAAGAGHDAAGQKSFHDHIAAVLERGKSAVRGIVVLPGGEMDAAGVAAYRSLYLAAYQAAKGHDKGILMLGAGMTAATEKLLLNSPAGGADMGAYVDALATMQVGDELWRVKNAAARWGNRPVLVLPADQADQPALGLSLAPVVRSVPVAANDRGVTAHLLGGAVFYQRARPELWHTILVFQGDNYTLAAVAGLGAGGPPDGDWPDLPGQMKGPGKAAAGPTLQISDATGDLRVVDQAGNAVDCRQGDVLHVPLDDKVRYIISSESAEDLVALLRTCPIENGPMVEAEGAELVNGGAGAQLKVRLRNARTEDLEGRVRVFAAGDAEHKEMRGEAALKAAGPGQAVDVMMPVNGALVAGDECVVEVDDGHVKEAVRVRVTAAR